MARLGPFFVSQAILNQQNPLFRGHAELLGGLVGVTITIEAKGFIERKSNERLLLHSLCHIRTGHQHIPGHRHQFQ